MIEAAAQPFPPTLSDRYRIERELGRGGMATVYLADDLKHHRKVAIKVLHPECAAAIGAERFLREIEIAARLNHPHILPLFDSGAAEGRLFYVTPFVPGGSLRDRLAREKQLTVEDTLRLALEIASALGHAHREGLVHRDIKPENVLLSEGLALVADFGIARTAGAKGGERLTTVSAVIGTPRYMAPEQALGCPDVDGRADLYALGCIVYEMLAGQPPFTGPEESLAYQHLSVEPRPVTDLRPAVPGALAAAIARALAKLPADRYSTAADFAEALSAAASHGPAPTPSPAAEAGGIPNNLPRPRTRFIGRERELAECARALGDSRILTLTGVGGCGKTRLALRIAEALLADFPDGVWWADLGPLQDADRAALALATALGVREQPGTPLAEALAARLRERRTLVVLDNCEHVLAAAAELADRLVAATDGLKLIVTSREGLGIEGERLFALQSLSVPAACSPGDLRAAEASEAVRLFVDRAQVLDAHFALTATTAAVVAEICRRLDGIPLAIELAAARITVLKVEDIAARLHDRFRLLTGGSRTALPRHQTLRATIQWSYDQLAGEEQRLLRSLAVFAGGWTLAAATHVAGERADEFEVLDLTTRLVRKSLVTVNREAEGETRYAMLETVRQYAQERLNEAGEGDRARSHHLAFHVALAEEAEPGLLGSEQEAWCARLLREQENLLAAHAWCDRAEGGAGDGLRLVGALRRFWPFYGRQVLGHRVTLEALARPGAERRTDARAKALYAAGNLAYFLGRYEEARATAEEGLAIARETGSEERACDALWSLGMACHALGDLQVAKSHLSEFIARARALGDLERLGQGLNNLAEVLRAEADLDAAERLYGEALDLFRRRGDHDNSVIATINLVYVAMPRGDLDRATALLLDCLAAGPPTSMQTAGNLLDQLGALFALRGEWTRAARLDGAADAQFARTGSHRDPADEVFLGPLVERARAALGEAAFAAASAEGAALESNATLAEARGWLETGRPSRAAPTIPAARPGA